jgi:outer membrane protein OmpA-like peptidoglycan-associated protein
MNRIVLPVLFTLVAACGGKAQTPPQTASVTTTRTETVDKTPTPVSNNVAVGADILRACNIEFQNPTDAPKFAYDDSKLEESDTNVLEKVATCLTSGPLKGRSVELVGRADPRGTVEYNMALGDHRADQVLKFLQQRGVARVKETSRGALDAQGRDENGWRQDRRVDLVLGS